MVTAVTASRNDPSAVCTITRITENGSHRDDRTKVVQNFVRVVALELGMLRMLVIVGVLLMPCATATGEPTVRAEIEHIVISAEDDVECEEDVEDVGKDLEDVDRNLDDIGQDLDERKTEVAPANAPDTTPATVQASSPETADGFYCTAGPAYSASVS